MTTSILYHAEIQHSISTLTITQTIKNSDLKVISSDYHLKIADSAILFSISLKTSENKTFLSKINSNPTQDLTISDSSNLFLIPVEDLSPSSSLKIEFILIFPLSTDGLFWKFFIDESLFPVMSFSEDATFCLEVKINSVSPIDSYSYNCEMTWQAEDDSRVIQGTTGTCPVTSLNESFLWVKFRTQNSNIPAYIVQQVEKRFFGMFSFIPCPEDLNLLQELEGPGEFLYLIDRSPAMDLAKIEPAKQAGIILLKSLPQSAFFNVFSFADKTQAMFSTSQNVMSKYLNKAVKSLLSFRADLPGFDLFNTLKTVLTQENDPKIPRTLFLVFSGQIYNPNQVLQLVYQYKGLVRLHVFALGSENDWKFFKVLAKATSGVVRVLESPEDLRKAVISALQESTRPCSTSWTMTWPGECLPDVSRVGLVRYGEPVTQFIMFEEKPVKPVFVKYLDTLNTNVREFLLSDPCHVTGNSFFLLWTKAKIEDFMFDLRNKLEDIKSLALNAGISSISTGFSLFSEKNGRNRGCLEVRTCGSEFLVTLVDDQEKSTCQKPVVDNQIVYIAGIPIKKSRKLISWKLNTPEVKKGPKTTSFVKDSFDTVNSQYMGIIITLERTGFWKYKMLSKSFPNMKKIPEEYLCCDNRFDAYSTLFMIALLHKKFWIRADEWVLIEKKALKWLADRNVDFSQHKDVMMGFV